MACTLGLTDCTFYVDQELAEEISTTTAYCFESEDFGPYRVENPKRGAAWYGANQLATDVGVLTEDVAPCSDRRVEQDDIVLDG